MADNETKLIVKAAAEGTQAVIDELAKIGKTADKTAKQQKDSAKNAKSEVDRLTKTYGGVTAKVVALQKAMKDTEKGTASYEVLNRSLNKTQKEAESLTRTITILTREVGKYQERAAAFKQGMAQGSGMGEFIQRNNMGSQLGGRAVGAGARAAGGFAFGGIEGLAKGISGVPLLGGFVGSQIMQGAGMASLAMQREQIEMDMAPNMGNMEAITTARQQALEKANPMTRKQMRHLAQTRAVDGGHIGWGSTDEDRERAIREQLMPIETAENERVYEELQKVNKTLQASGYLPNISGGEALGAMDSNQFAQFINQIASASGSGIESATGAFGSLALASQTALGVNGSVSAQFLRGAEFGFGGAGSSGTQGLVDAIKDAVSLGLQGSDLQNYVAQMAGDIRNFEVNGLPLARDTITDFAKTIAATGIAGGTRRGNNVGRGLLGGIRRVGQTGPQSAGDVLALRELGGFKGGSFEDMFGALSRMEQGQFDEDQLQGYLSKLTNLGGRRAPQVVYSELNRMGGQITREDAMRMVQGIQGGELSDEHRTTLTKTLQAMQASAQKSSNMTEESIIKTAKGIVGGTSLQEQAELGTQKIGIGARWLPLTKAMERNATAMTEMSSSIAPALNTAMGTLEDMKDGIGDVVKSIQNLMDRMD